MASSEGELNPPILRTKLHTPVTVLLTEVEFSSLQSFGAKHQKKNVPISFRETKQMAVIAFPVPCLNLKEKKASRWKEVMKGEGLMRELCRLLVKKTMRRSSGTSALDAACGKPSQPMAEAAGWPGTCFRGQKTGEMGREGHTDRHTHTQSKTKLFYKLSY